MCTVKWKYQICQSIKKQKTYLKTSKRLQGQQLFPICAEHNKDLKQREEEEWFSTQRAYNYLSK